MPKSAIDYSKTIIYKIVCKDLNIKGCYVGQTTNFIKRKTQHKHSCNKEGNRQYDDYVYRFIRDNGGWNNWDMIQVEKYPDCKDLNDAHQRERYWIEHLNADLNKQLNLSKKEYVDKHKDEKQKYDIKYRENNLEKKKENHKKYYNDNKERLKEYQKEYKLNNPEKIKERNRLYHLKRKFLTRKRHKIRIIMSIPHFIITC